MANIEILNNDPLSAGYGKILPQFIPAIVPPPIPTTPSLAQVLAAGNDTAGQNILATSGKVVANTIEANTIQAVGAPLFTTIALSSDLDGQSVSRMTNIKKLTFNNPAGAPSEYSIDGVYNIDSGTLPYPVMRFSSAKAGGTQQKSLTLQMTDGEAIWSSQWEGYLPTGIRTKQNVFTIDGQGAGALTDIKSDAVNITPNFASGSVVSITGSLSATSLSGSGLAITGTASATSAPVAGDDLCNKTYVDATAGFSRPNNAVYVAKNGNDTTGNGSLGRPYLTISKAVQIVEAGSGPTASNPAVIYVYPGTYTESIALTKGYTTILGPSTSQNNSQNGVRIIGNITITATGANDLYNRIFALQGLYIASTTSAAAIFDNTTTTQHSVVVQDCRIIGVDKVVYLASAVETRNGFINCEISHGSTTANTNPVFEITNGWLEMERCDLTARNANADVLTFSGTSYPWKVILTNFTSESASATANPIVRYATTQTSVGSIGNCAFTYESPTIKTSPNSSGFLFDTGSFVYPSATPVMIFLNNYFTLNGIFSTASPVIAKRSTTTGTPIILYSPQYAAPTLASKIQGGGAIVHQSWNVVN
jgi:hypothetical protein